MISIQLRPLLISAQLRVNSISGHIVILVDSEQSREEQSLSFWHEVVHLLGVEDCGKAEELARRLATHNTDVFLSILEEHE